MSDRMVIFIYRLSLSLEYVTDSSRGRANQQIGREVRRDSRRCNDQKLLGFELPVKCPGACYCAARLQGAARASGSLI